MSGSEWRAAPAAASAPEPRAASPSLASGLICILWPVYVACVTPVSSEETMYTKQQ